MKAVKAISAAVAAVIFFSAAVTAENMGMPSVDQGKLMGQVELKKEAVAKGAVKAEKAGAVIEEKGMVVEQKSVELEKTGKAGKAAPKAGKLGKTMKSKGKVVKEGGGKLGSAAGPACK